MPSWITTIALPIAAALALAAVMWLRRPRRPRTDPEDYDRRSRFPAKRADDELAEQERAERQRQADEFQAAWEEWHSWPSR